MKTLTDVVKQERPHVGATQLCSDVALQIFNRTIPLNSSTFDLRIKDLHNDDEVLAAAQPLDWATVFYTLASAAEMLYVNLPMSHQQVFACPDGAEDLVQSLRSLASAMVAQHLFAIVAEGERLIQMTAMKFSHWESDLEKRLRSEDALAKFRLYVYLRCKRDDES